MEPLTVALTPQTKCPSGSGHLGLIKLQADSQTPHEKSNLHPLTGEQKARNRRLARERVVAEHIIRSLNIFRLLAERSRNRRKRFNGVPRSARSNALAHPLA